MGDEKKRGSFLPRLRDAFGNFVSRPFVQIAAAIFLIYEIDDIMAAITKPSAQELVENIKLTSLWKELAADGFVHGPFNNGHPALGNLPRDGQLQILATGGFDVTRDGGATEHWRVVWNPDGTVQDVVPANHGTTPMPALGVGPMLIEDADDIDPNERWDWTSMSDNRHLTPEEYAVAADYFKSLGMHPYQPGEKIDIMKLISQTHAVDSHITATDIKEIILKNGGRFEDKFGTVYQIWVGDKGPVLHQIPNSLAPNAPHIDNMGIWRDSADKIIPLQRR